MSKSIDSIDTGRDTVAAQNYAARNAKLLASLDKEEVEVKAPVIAPLFDTPTTSSASSDQTMQHTKPALVEALGLQESNETIEIILNFTTSNNSPAVFSVSVKPIATNITEDCVTLLIDSSVNVKPPTLLPLFVKKSGVTYPVVYAGTILQTPKLNVLSFLRTAV